MIDKKNLGDMLLHLGFTQTGKVYEKQFTHPDSSLKVDFDKQEIIYPEEKGLTINERQTCNFSSNENFVVLECVNRLLEKGYKPEHLELEPKWKVGHGASGGRADILVKDNFEKPLLIIECKTAGREHDIAWKDTLLNGGQLFTYARQVGSTQFLCLYSCDFVDKEVLPTYQLITLKDNEKLLEEKQNDNPLSYEKAQDVKELYQAWLETYSRDYATKGIFEDDIPAYLISKQKYSLRDLHSVSNKDIQGKYHEFATILRQHNVSGRENAFDKLVNLFLCKIVDENQNPNELKFYWKGIAYDTNFDLQDRLQLLYQAGMKEFLGEEVTYVDNAAIDEAFRFFKNDPDATRETIKRYFRELKFFTNNDFAFIDVHNEKLFYQNAAVLLKIVKMLQDIRLKTEEQNQFLGDMFEGFLDQGVKQSEGQFFTPMPMVKFIVSSLPLEQIVIDHEQPPQVIDFACGPGHFLNEYAVQIKPLVERHKATPLADYYGAIVGIEKEYRLSKVAKVSAFMYGQENVQIIYNDALAQIPRIKDGNYALLVANPPYSVKGYLEMLSEADRRRFTLIDSIDEKSYTTNNSIEAFFIERAKQLLKADGVAGIIAPSSILSKGGGRITAKKTNVYVAAREILLTYFDIVAIAEFGSGTFGKTGTNTVTLFLRRRKENPAPADHYRNRLESWFSGDDDKDAVFADEYFIRNYCAHLEYTLADYKTLLQGKPNEALLKTEMFVEYRQEFNKLAETKNRKKQKSFKALDKTEQQAAMDQRFLEYVQAIERDKLYYFVLASLNRTETVIVRSPTGTSESKKFLGYEWSSAKGNEGIKYLGGQRVDDKDIEGEEVLEQDDKRVLENLLNLNNIHTPLYDPHNMHNGEKINSLIRANFNGEPVTVPEALQEFVTTARLVDMLDFSRKEFDKTISLTPKKAIIIESKWEVFPLDQLMKIVRGASPRPISKYLTEDENGVNWIKIGDVEPESKYISKTIEKITIEGAKKSREVNIGDFVLSNSMSYGRPYIVNIHGYIHDGWLLLSNFDNRLIKEYLYYILSSDTVQKQFNNLATGITVDNLNVERVSSVKIPLPPLDVQEQIVRECEAMDEEVAQAQQAIEQAEQEIEKAIIDIAQKGYPNKKTEDFAEINPSKTEIRQIDDETMVSFVEMASVSDEGYIAKKEDKPLKEVRASSYTYFREDDIIIAKITPSMENGKCAIAEGLTNNLGMGSSEFHVIRADKAIALPEYVFAFLNRESVRQEAATKMTGASGHRRVPASFYEQFVIPLPQDIKVQEDLITKIKNQKTAITQSKQIIEGSAERKQAILKKYL